MAALPSLKIPSSPVPSLGTLDRPTPWPRRRTDRIAFSFLCADQQMTTDGYRQMMYHRRIGHQVEMLFLSARVRILRRRARKKKVDTLTPPGPCPRHDSYPALALRGRSTSDNTTYVSWAGGPMLAYPGRGTHGSLRHPSLWIRWVGTGIGRPNLSPAWPDLCCASSCGTPTKMKPAATDRPDGLSVGLYRQAGSWPTVLVPRRRWYTYEYDMLCLWRRIEACRDATGSATA